MFITVWFTKKFFVNLKLYVFCHSIGTSSTSEKLVGPTGKYCNSAAISIVAIPGAVSSCISTETLLAVPSKWSDNGSW